jgi:hypothetical protein
MTLRELERRLKAEPENLDLRVQVARALRAAGRHIEAVELYRSVAIAYCEEGRSSQAIAACRSLLEIAPDDARCHAMMAVLDAGEAGAPEGERPVRKLELPLPAVGGAVPRTRTPPVGIPVPRTKTPPAGVPSAPEREAPTRGSSSFDETPLPPAMPHHIADPTARLQRISESDLPTTEGAPTRPGSDVGSQPVVSGIANAARRISASLIGAGAGMRERMGAKIDFDFDSDEPTSTGGRSGAVPDERGDDDEEDQTRPRDLPMGIRRPGPAVHAPGVPTPAPSAQRMLAFTFFAPLPADRRVAVLSRFSRRSVPPGTVVIRQGELAPSLVLVASGRLEVRVERAGRPIALGPVGPGEHIGEVPLLARAPSQTSVIAATEAELLVLSPRDFYEIAGEFPALWAALKESAERRTREYAARLS